MSRYDRSASQGPRSVILTIGEDESVSDVLDRPFEPYFALLIPTGMEGTKISFLASTTIDGTFVKVNDETKTLIEHDIEAASWLTLPASTLARLSAFRFVKVKSNATESAARSIEVALAEG